MRKRSETVPQDLPAICRRVAWLLLNVWNNNVTRMAKDLGVSQPALSRVLSGQAPSGRMLEALAGKAGVNARWLLTGQGAEAADPLRMPGVVSCPLATGLLDDTPLNRPERLAGTVMPAASPYLLEAAYWVRVEDGDPIAKARRERVAEGDFLLVETAPSRVSRVEAILGRVVVLRRAGKPPILARVGKDEEYFRGDGWHELDAFGLFDEAFLVPRARREEAGPAPPGEEGTELYYADDVAGVVLQVARLM